ncbi:SRPBCC family protein [Methylotetracoccus oryzae]|uniref:SRPBCC family protein n=1 Tax=Methylotetracoccus oryzae TaxID=1919059 RepID=UPI00111B1260|nr:SRPBCC family protein [Methylotetracoccus oryzae]
MLANTLIGIAVLVAALLVYAATRPGTFRIERSIVIQAPAEKVFAWINVLRAWSRWSPWEAKDPGMRRSFSGTDSGKGAAYAWEGNKNVGTGRMEIIEASPPNRIVIKLDFIKPFEAHNTVEFTLQARGAATQVTWAMFGPMPYLSKLMTTFYSMDKMCGKDFEAGLAQLKAAAEQD